MKYSTEPRKIKYFEGYSFLSFARKFGDKYGKNLMDTATKTRIDCNWTQTQNHLVRKRTLNHLVNLAKCLSVRLRT